MRLFLMQHSPSLVTCLLLFTMHGRVRQVRTFEEYRLSECASLASSVLYSLVLQTWLANTRTGWRNVAPKRYFVCLLFNTTHNLIVLALLLLSRETWQQRATCTVPLPVLISALTSFLSPSVNTSGPVLTGNNIRNRKSESK